MIELANYVEWKDLNRRRAHDFTCGNCNNLVSSEKGYLFQRKYYSPTTKESSLITSRGGIYICPSCKFPSCFDDDLDFQYPGPKVGENVLHLPKEIHDIYEEARSCYSIGAFTACVLLGRKILMNISVEDGAKEGESFAFYVGYLLEKHFITKKSELWVDKIRTSGNSANHSVEKKEEKDARNIINFLGMILKTNYEYLHELQEEEESN